MPTYRFQCKPCNRMWEEMQELYLDGSEHLSECHKCHTQCKNTAFGGTGTLLKGRHLNKYLEGFPDQTARINAEANKEGEEMEKDYDAYVAEQLREEND